MLPIINDAAARKRLREATKPAEKTETRQNVPVAGKHGDLAVPVDVFLEVGDPCVGSRMQAHSAPNDADAPSADRVFASPKRLANPLPCLQDVP